MVVYQIMRLEYATALSVLTWQLIRPQYGIQCEEVVADYTRTKESYFRRQSSFGSQMIMVKFCNTTVRFKVG